MRFSCLGPFNPLSLNSDQHQISPCNVNAYSTPEVMRIKDMITQGEFSFISKVCGQDRRICSLILGSESEINHFTIRRIKLVNVVKIKRQSHN